MFLFCFDKVRNNRNKSVNTLQTLLVMNNHDFFFEGLSPSKTKEILLQENVPFSFLVRKIGREHVVSFLDDHFNVKHQILPKRHDSSLFRHHPQLQNQGPLGVFNFLRNISTDWLHPVLKTDETRIKIKLDC